MNIEDYILEHTDPESELLKELVRDAHVNLLRPRMMAGHLQGRTLKMFCRMMAPRRILEIGTYTGYATLCMAEGTDENTIIHTIEIDDEMETFMMKYFRRSPYMGKIKVHFGDAAEIIPRLNEVFDLVFIDAEKHQYVQYYNLVFPILRNGGVILADNTLWDGKVMSGASDKQTTGIATFNEMVRDDSRVEKILLPLRDGLTVIWKK
ncbi:MAG: O-methyltransferase [Tannerellaceae bacterium]|jgi:predicted O-methyltransferase YrrM|nr:O-methyltransferase [Tannerellaceae bacterium]